MKLPLPRVACPHSTSAATTSRPKHCPCALSLSQRPSSGETESASSNEAMPRHSLLSSRRITKENLFGSGACSLFSHRVTYSLHDGGSHGMNLAMAGVMHPKTSRASVIWNWLSCNLRDRMTIIVSAFLAQLLLDPTQEKFPGFLNAHLETLPRLWLPPALLSRTIQTT